MDSVFVQGHKDFEYLVIDGDLRMGLHNYYKIIRGFLGKTSF